MSVFTMRSRRMIRFARNILVQQNLYARLGFQAALRARSTPRVVSYGGGEATKKMSEQFRVLSLLTVAP